MGLPRLALLCMFGSRALGRVAVIITGQLRLPRAGVGAVRARCVGATVFVSTYDSEADVAYALASNRNQTLLASAVDVARARQRAGCCKWETTGSCWQWWLLDRGLRRWNETLRAMDAVVRTRTDLSTPPSFSYAQLAGPADSISCLTDNLFVSTGSTFLRVFGGFFDLCEAKYCATAASSAAVWRDYTARFQDLVVQGNASSGGSLFRSCKRAPRPNHVVHNVPWMNLNRKASAGVFYSEYAFAYHVVASGARCLPLDVEGAFCLEKSATDGRGQCREAAGRPR